MSEHILFSAFHKDNLIDKLLGELKENFKWNIDEIDSVFHKYHWCNIILTEEIISRDKLDLEEREAIDKFPFKFDLLGQYLNEKQEIKLSIRKIEECASQKFKADNKKRKNIIEKLSYIILIHEIAHWIVYAIKDHEGEVLKETLDTGIDKKNFHEGLAQYFTCYIIQNDTELLGIFKKLNKRQPDEYKVFKEIFKKDISDIMIAISVSRKKNKQSWEFLKSVIEISKKDKRDLVEKKDINNFLEKHRGKFMGKQYGF